MTDPNTPRTTGSEYAEHILAVVKRAAEVDAAQNTPKIERSSAATRVPVILAVTVAFVGVVMWNFNQWAVEPPPLPQPEQETSLEVSLLVATQMIEAHRDQTGALPASLTELGIPEAAFTYRVLDEQYELFATEGGVTVRYDSLDGAESLLERLQNTAADGR